MSISNIKELYQELKFTTVDSVSNKNIFGYINATVETTLNEKLTVYENNSIVDQNIFSLNISDNSSYNISGNLEKFPSVNFRNCQWLETVELPKTLWNYSNNDYETSMSYCFYNCSNLKYISNLPDNINDLSLTFSYCPKLEFISNVPNNVSNLYSCFSFCNNLISSPTYIGENIEKNKQYGLLLNDATYAEIIKLSEKVGIDAAKYLKEVG